MVEAMVNQIEMACGLGTRVGLEALIETGARHGQRGRDRPLRRPAGGAAFRGGRLCRLDAGAHGEYRRPQPRLSGRSVHASNPPPFTRMVIACRAFGLRAIDGPFGDFSDPGEGYMAGARRAAALGCEGKWAIHSGQWSWPTRCSARPRRNSPRPPHHRGAAQGRGRGKGAAALDGKMIDARSERMANNVITVAEAIAARAEAPHDGPCRCPGARMWRRNPWTSMNTRPRKSWRAFGVPVPRGGLAYSPEQAGYRARELGGAAWVVKAQVHSGGRGEAGGVKLCRSEEEVRDFAATLFGKQLVTKQTGPAGKGVYGSGWKAPPTSHRNSTRLRAGPEIRAHHDRGLVPWRNGDRGPGRARP